MSKFSLILFSLMAFVALSSNVLNEKAITTFKVDPTSSSLKWTGKKVTGEHTGVVKISSGSFVIDGKAVKSGSFEIDLSSLTVTDIGRQVFK